jgi:hypothetical protein
VPPSDAERFWSKVSKSDGCWLWRSGTSERYYPYFRIGGQRIGAHRVAYLLTHGEIPADLDVLHHCDTPRCVNPVHLFLGTAQDNCQDAARKGRTFRPRGELSGSAKLTEAKVREIRTRYAEGTGPRPLAREFGVDRSTIREIVCRRTWCDVN